MSEKKYYWLKLPTGFFKDRPMKKLRRMAGGAVYTIIYQKLLLLSLENEGKIYFENIEDSFEEEMSLELDETVEDVQMTILALTKYNLMQQNNEFTYEMLQVPEMIGSETDAARRQRKSRGNIKNYQKQIPAKTNAERAKISRAKKAIEGNQHIPYIENYENKNRYNGLYYVVFKRDNCQCSLCGSIEKLCVHHIDGYNENDIEITCREDNMITLCRTCHSNIHNKTLEIPGVILKNIKYRNEFVTKSQEVTKCHIEIEKEKEKEKDKYINKENNCIKSDYDIQLEWFDTVWKLYPRKEGKHRIIKSKTKLKELYKDKENVEAATINYAKKVENTEKQFIKKGSTFYNYDYLDFISVQDEKNEYLKNKYGI